MASVMRIPLSQAFAIYKQAASYRRQAHIFAIIIPIISIEVLAVETIFTSTHLEDLYLRLPSFAARQQKWPQWDPGPSGQGRYFGDAASLFQHIPSFI